MSRTLLSASGGRIRRGARHDDDDGSRVALDRRLTAPEHRGMDPVTVMALQRSAGNRAVSALLEGTITVQRAKGDRVEYDGGGGGRMRVRRAGEVVIEIPVISGHEGTEEHDVGAGPIPTGWYAVTPQVTQPTVSEMQHGTCGARPISRGYQEIESRQQAACPHHSHYCTEACPTQGNAEQTCFTPQGCWGPRRVKIEGYGRAKGPKGTVTRGGFYIHGGHPGVIASSGCIKVFDDSVFDHLRTLKGTIPLCVGAACPPQPGPAPGPSPGPAAATGTVTASSLRIRAGPSTATAQTGSYANGATVTVTCTVTGERINGNATWARTPQGFVSEAYLRRSGAAPAC